MAVGVGVSLITTGWRRCTIAVVSWVSTASGLCVVIDWRAAGAGWGRACVGISAVVIVARRGTSATVIVITTRAVTTSTAARGTTTSAVSVIVVGRRAAVTTATTTRRRRARTVTRVARRWGWHARDLGLGLDRCVRTPSITHDERTYVRNAADGGTLEFLTV
jgi:hypothetical protein